MFITVLITTVIVAVNCSWNPTGPIIFEDNFDGYKLNQNEWQVQKGHKIYGANRLMCFQEKNVKVEEGSLILTAMPENVYCDKKHIQYTSGRVRTKKRFNYTAIEFEARVSKGEHLQPGLWTQFSSNNIYEEVDVMEVKGTETRKYHTNAHWGRHYSRLVNRGHTINVMSDLSKTYHRFGFEKNESVLNFYFDGELKASTSLDEKIWKKSHNTPDSDVTPFYEPAHVLISLLVSGNWFQNDEKLTQKIAREWEKATLEVDKVTVYGYN